MYRKVFVRQLGYSEGI